MAERENPWSRLGDAMKGAAQQVVDVLRDAAPLEGLLIEYRVPEGEGHRTVSFLVRQGLRGSYLAFPSGERCCAACLERTAPAVARFLGVSEPSSASTDELAAAVVAAWRDCSRCGSRVGLRTPESAVVHPVEPRIRLVEVEGPVAPPPEAAAPREERPRISVVERAQGHAASPRVGVSSSSEAGSNASPCVSEPRFTLADGTAVVMSLGRRARADIVRHCGTSCASGREVGGVLFGWKQTIEVDGGSPSLEIHVTDVLPIETPDSSLSHVSFDADVWPQVAETFEREYAPDGKHRLGWYHTHPVQGIFFSSHDRDAHSIWRQPHQVAIVVDPRTMAAGLFFWRSVAERELGGPELFSLRTTSDSDVPRGGAEAGRAATRGSTVHATGEPPTRVLWTRVVLAVVALGALLPGLAVSGQLDLRSADAWILGIASAIVVARLAKLGFFAGEAHPEPPPARRAPSYEEPVGWGAAILFTVLFIVTLFLVGFALLVIASPSLSGTVG